MKVSVVYTYDAPINPDLDAHIRWQADLLGWHEWASGVDLESHRRDISFDVEFADGAFDSEAGEDVKDLMEQAAAGGPDIQEQIDVAEEANASLG